MNIRLNRRIHFPVKFVILTFIVFLWLHIKPALRFQWRSVYIVYYRTYQEFNESRVELREATELFIQGIIDTVIQIIVKAMFGLVTSITKMAIGAPPTGRYYTCLCFYRKDVTDISSEQRGIISYPRHCGIVTKTQYQ